MPWMKRLRQESIAFSIIFLDLTIMSASPATVAGVPPDIRKTADLPFEWFSCRTVDDCVIVRRSCSMSYALNKSHAQEAMKQIEKFCSQHPMDGCPVVACLAVPPPARGVICNNNECTILR
jgi:hypothetical protein